MHQTVTFSFVPEQVIIGLMAGLFAGLLICGRGVGLVARIVVGLLHLPLPTAFQGGITLAWSDMFVAFIGAVIIFIIFGGLYRARR